jgi:type IV secretory pathway TrbL component
MVVIIAIATIRVNRFLLNTPADSAIDATITSVEPRAFMALASASELIDITSAVASLGLRCRTSSSDCFTAARSGGSEAAGRATGEDTLGTTIVRATCRRLLRRSRVYLFESIHQAILVRGGEDFPLVCRLTKAPSRSGTLCG